MALEIDEKTKIIKHTFADILPDFTLNEETIDKIIRFSDYLLEENEKYNLTAIRDFEGVIKKHVCDSLTISKYLPENSEVVDVGTGAGFPAVPLAISRPDLRITALDSTEKKIKFIETAVKMLSLENLTAIYGRAEELSTNGGLLRESFDCCVARSVASLPQLSELCLPFVKTGGKFISMKSHTALFEVGESRNALKTLGCDAENEIFSLDFQEFDKNPSDFNGKHIKIKILYESCGDIRVAYIFNKDRNTPSAFPRAYAKIKKKPL